MTGNTPAGLVDLDRRPGSASLLYFDSGTNVAPGSLQRGGSIGSPNLFPPDAGFGSVGFAREQLTRQLEEIITSTRDDQAEAFARRNPDAFGILINLDLGARFGVDAIRFFPRNTARPSPSTPFQNDYLRAFELAVNDGVAVTENGNPSFTPLVVESGNRDSIIVVELDPPRIIQHLQLKSTTPIDWEIDELEVYGRGYVPSASYISDIFDAGQPASWIRLRWREGIDGDPERSGLRIRTRTGTDDTPFRFNRRLRGNSDAPETPCRIVGGSGPGCQMMNWEEYRSLPATDSDGQTWDRGSIEADRRNWSPFAAFETFSPHGHEARLRSPGPRRYFQFMVDFDSSDIDSGRWLSSLSFDFAVPPVADSLVAEIFPRRAVMSRISTFAFALRAVMQTDQLLGFDTVQISLPTPLAGIERVTLHDEAMNLVAERGFSGLSDRSEVAGFQILSVGSEGFTMRVPPVRENGHLLQIRFQTKVLAYSTEFPARVWMSSDSLAVQDAVPGNATWMGDGDTPARSSVTVVSPTALTQGDLLAGFTAVPRIFSPNGDGVNDQLSVRYNLLSLSAPRPVEVAVFALSGERIRLLSRRREISDYYGEKEWDGKDDSGRRVVPGIYLLRIQVEADASEERASAVVGVAY